MAENTPEMVTLRDYVEEIRKTALAYNAQCYEDLVRQIARVADINTLRHENWGQAREQLYGAIQQRFAAAERSNDVAREALDKRLESMNEFRSQLNTQAGFFVNRIEMEEKVKTVLATVEGNERRILVLEQTKLNTTLHDGLELRMQKLEQASANFEGRMWSIGAGVGLFSIAVAIALRFFH